MQWIVFRTDTGAFDPVLAFDTEGQAQAHIAGLADSDLHLAFPLEESRPHYVAVVYPPRRRRRKQEMTPAEPPLRVRSKPTLNRPALRARRGELYLDQGGRCAICLRIDGEVGGLNLDHNHVTGEVRGLLCRSCNLGIGLLRSDEGPELLERALAYTLKHD